MKRNLTHTILAAVLATATASWAMPGPAHRSLDELLLSTAPEDGGSRGMTREAMESMDNWMDYFSKDLLGNNLVIMGGGSAGWCSSSHRGIAAESVGLPSGERVEL